MLLVRYFAFFFLQSLVVTEFTRMFSLKSTHFSLTLQEGIYDLYWNFSTVDETIHFAVKVKTTGWVGFGISPNGQMPGSDVIIAWVDGEKAYFQVSEACISNA